MDKTIAAECERALEKYRSGESEVKFEIGGLALRLWDRKDNDDRETVRMSMEELTSLVRACHVNGAALAASTMASVAATLAGLRAVDVDDSTDAD